MGIVPIVNKLPYQWREKWAMMADYKQRMNVTSLPVTRKVGDKGGGLQAAHECDLSPPLLLCAVYTGT